MNVLVVGGTGFVGPHVVGALVAPLSRLPWQWDRLGPWQGGSALQTCLRRGWVGYDFVVFRRRPRALPSGGGPGILRSRHAL